MLILVRNHFLNRWIDFYWIHNNNHIFFIRKKRDWESVLWSLVTFTTKYPIPQGTTPQAAWRHGWLTPPSTLDQTNKQTYPLLAHLDSLLETELKKKPLYILVWFWAFFYCLQVFDQRFFLLSNFRNIYFTVI